MCNTTSKQWNWADGTVLNYKPPSGGNAAGSSPKLESLKDKKKDNLDLDKDCIAPMNWAIQSNGYWYSGDFLRNIPNLWLKSYQLPSW